jgi:MutT/NUDIX family protein
MILIGEKNENIKYDFRETVFGICLKNEELYLTKKGEDISLIGGGIELNETEETTLKREALEEAGLEIIGMNKICDIDCYWKTRDNRDMESLTHIYQIEISDKIIEPLEVESKLVKMSINEAKNQLKLPYQKQGLTEFLNKIK